MRSADSEGGDRLKLLEDGSYLATGKNPSNDVYRVALDTVSSHHWFIAGSIPPMQACPTKASGRGFNGNFILTDLEVAWSF